MPVAPPRSSSSSAPRPTAAAAGAIAPARRLIWPQPPLPSYGPAVESTAGQPCVIEANLGRVVHAQLLGFDPQRRIITVLASGATGPITLGFDQFRTLTITSRLMPRRAPPGAPPQAAAVLEGRPRVPYLVTLKAGGALRGMTIGHVEHASGLFLFPPVDDGDSVLRMFVPQDVIAQFRVGPRVGDVLVAQRSATPEQVEHAVEQQQQLRAGKLGELLMRTQVVTHDGLAQALELQGRMPVIRVGEALLSLGLIKPTQLEAALLLQKSDRQVPLGEMLVRQNAISRDDLRVALASKMGYPIVDLAQFPVESAAMRRIPFAAAQRLRALPLAFHGAHLVVALEDVTLRSTLDELEFLAQAKVSPALAVAGQIDEALRRCYARLGNEVAVSAATPASADPFAPDNKDGGQLVETLDREGEAQGAADEKPIEQSDNSLVRLINQMIIEAHADGASDIHIECSPGRQKVKIRFRKDGELRPYQELQHTYRSAIVARIKIMCDLDISERRKPQDGKINFARFSPQTKLELRVATIPTVNGLEDVVMRLLASARPIPLSGLGLSAINQAWLQAAIERPYGMVLCVGPTGSGKTTTLHSALGHINRPESKIWTAEDPIEITQAGLRQVQVNPKIDWTFAKALRAFLRADPDVIMVGEVRDQETAQIVVEAALTGHLVLSTLHTNTAPETITRLLDMGLDPFNFADALLAVVAQRLVRKLCPKCRTARPATGAQIEELLDDFRNVGEVDVPALARGAVLADWTTRFAVEGRLMHYSSPGCKHCGGTGLRGRVGIHELMRVGRAQRRLIQTRSTAAQLQASAIVDGMRTLRQDGIEKVLQGLTTIEEVRATSNE